MPAPEFSTVGNDRTLSVLAWALVALAMLLALLVLVAGIAGQYAADHPPVIATIQPAPDTIAPPKSLQRPCDPLFQRCEVTP